MNACCLKNWLPFNKIICPNFIWCGFPGSHTFCPITSLPPSLDINYLLLTWVFMGLPLSLLPTTPYPFPLPFFIFFLPALLFCPSSTPVFFSFDSSLLHPYFSPPSPVFTHISPIILYSNNICG